VGGLDRPAPGGGDAHAVMVLRPLFSYCGWDAAAETARASSESPGLFRWSLSRNRQASRPSRSTRTREGGRRGACASIPAAGRFSVLTRGADRNRCVSRTRRCRSTAATSARASSGESGAMTRTETSFSAVAFRRSSWSNCSRQAGHQAPRVKARRTRRPRYSASVTGFPSVSGREIAGAGGLPEAAESVRANVSAPRTRLVTSSV
jgi:hypothetical protein